MPSIRATRTAPNGPAQQQVINAALGRDAAPRGAIVVLPELPSRLAEPQAIADAVGAALKDDVRFVVAYDLDEETMLKRADAEHAAALAAEPMPAAPDDISEAEYEALSDAARDAFEGSRRDHRRAVRAWKERVAALEVAKGTRAEELSLIHI